MATKVSIVMPTYNQADYLPAALESIEAQTFCDFELIVVNDGSTDHTPQVLEELRSRMRFLLIEQANKGLPLALNAGFAQARGRYLTWTSSDNIMLPDMLKVLVKELDSDNSVGVVYTDWYFIDEKGNTTSLFRTLDYNRFLLLYNNIVHCSFLFRRECMEKVGLYDPELIYGEDWEYWIRLSRFYKMKRVPQPLYKYRLHRNTMTSDIVQGKVRETGYDKFSLRLRRQSPLAWYYARIKWRAVSWLSGRDMRKEWLEAIRVAF